MSEMYMRTWSISHTCIGDEKGMSLFYFAKNFKLKSIFLSRDQKRAEPEIQFRAAANSPDAEPIIRTAVDNRKRQHWSWSIIS